MRRLAGPLAGLLEGAVEALHLVKWDKEESGALLLSGGQDVLVFIRKPECHSFSEGDFDGYGSHDVADASVGDDQDTEGP